MKWLAMLFLFLTVMETASAAGIGVSPDKIEYSAREGESAERQLILYNPSKEEMIFFIKSEAYEDWFEFSESRGMIDKESSRKIIATVNVPKGTEKGTYSSKISITARNGVEGITINMGVAVEAVINVEKEDKDMTKIIGPVISASIVGVGLAVYGGVNKYNKK